MLCRKEWRNDIKGGSALDYPVRESRQPWALPVLKSGDFRADFDQLDFKALAESDELRRDWE
jgi:hypothetical protein